MKYITLLEVSKINEKLIYLYSNLEMSGVKDLNLLESAIGRPKQSAFGEDAYPTVFDKAAALFESLAKNHLFQNGNKRTAFASMVYFLYMNGFAFKMNQQLAEDFTVDMVNNKYSFIEIRDVLEENSSNIFQL